MMSDLDIIYNHIKRIEDLVTDSSDFLIRVSKFIPKDYEDELNVILGKSLWILTHYEDIDYKL